MRANRVVIAFPAGTDAPYFIKWSGINIHIPIDSFSPPALEMPSENGK